MSSLGRGYDPCHLRTAIKWSSSLPLHPRTPTSSMECRRDGDTDAPRSATQRRGQLRMATQRCERTVGRAAFQVSTWGWLICHWTDDVRIRCESTRETCADKVTVVAHGVSRSCPGNAAGLSHPRTGNKPHSRRAGRTEEQVQEGLLPRSTVQAGQCRERTQPQATAGL